MLIHRLKNLINSNISIKLISLVLGFIFLVIFSMSLYIQLTEKKVLSEQIDEYGYSLAKAIAIFAVEPMLIRDYPVLDTFALDMIQDTHDVIQIKIFRKDGKLVSQASAEQIDSLIKSHRVYLSKIKLNSPLSTGKVSNKKFNSLGHIQLILSTQRADNFIYKRLWTLTFISLVSMVFLVILMMIIIKKTLTKPLKNLTANAQLLAKEELNDPIMFKGEDELGLLADTLETMRKNLNASYEQITQQNQQLKLLDEAKDAFLARISHEINTPLNGILGMCSAISSHQYGKLEPLLLDAFSTIEQSSTRLKHLTDQLLSFSKVSDEDDLNKLEDFQCYEVLKFLVLPYTQDPAYNKIKFFITCDKTIQLNSNPVLFNQIFNNLLKNAIKFTEQGEINFHVTRLAQKKGSGIAISLCDTGIGISSQDQENIFNSFEQCSDYKSRQYEGIGLGLSMVKKSVELLNGKILLESKPNLGSCFTIILALEKNVSIDQLVDCWNSLELNLLNTQLLSKNSAAGNKEKITDTLAAREVESTTQIADDLDNFAKDNTSGIGTPTKHIYRILVVDDEATNRMVLTAHLKKDYDIVQAENGEQCLALLKTEQIDLVLLDIMMPIVSGLDVLEAVNADKIHHYPPIIIISALLQAKTKTQTFQLGAVDYVTKPFHREELLARIKTHLELSKKELSLEKKVQKRTRQLQKSNDLLAKNHQQLETSHHQLQQTNQRLEETFKQLLHSEKMASIGQLAAGTAHEINNPIGYIRSNINTLNDYINFLLELIGKYQLLENNYKNSVNDLSILENIQALKKSEDLDFIIEDIQVLLTDTSEGTNRVRSIVKGLTGFARQEDDEMSLANINDALESTIKLVWNELKYKTKINKSFAKLPDIVCNISQLIQVFTNILVNAAQAIEESGQINISTSQADRDIIISIADSGSGIKQEHLSKLFDPFFTTKAIGEGTGLGLYLSYEIIEKHGGSIEVESELGKGTEFIIRLPNTTG